MNGFPLMLVIDTIQLSQYYRYHSPFSLYCLFDHLSVFCFNYFDERLMSVGRYKEARDILHTMSGQTIECLNTDAEGRLVLADALWYTQDRFKPKFMLDLATLTGAITVALGRHYAGLFSNNDDLCDKLTKAGKAVDEKLWRFPTDDAYDKQIDSVIADVQNIGNEKGAGSITASKFLERFVNKTPWAHLDIAGVAWASKDIDFCSKGATAFGVRLLNELVMGLEK